MPSHQVADSGEVFKKIIEFTAAGTASEFLTINSLVV
jgi:hypothetical protein